MLSFLPTRRITHHVGAFALRLIVVLPLAVGGVHAQGEVTGQITGQVAGQSAPPPRATVEAIAGPVNPLSPLDTSSPRATLRSFRSTIDSIGASLRREGVAAQRRTENAHQIRLALTCLDLSAIAPSLVRSEGSQAAVCLKEVLDRIPLPADAEIPDAAAVAASSLKRWRIPGTEITLVRLADGNRDGDFVFSAESVARADTFYSRIRSLPYRPDAGSPGLHDFYVEAGGWMIPEAVIKALPSWAHTMILGETIWQWTAALLVVLAAMGAAILAWKTSRWLSTTDHLGSTGGLVLPASLVAISLAVDYLFCFQIRLTGDNLLAAKVGLRVITLVGVISGVLVAMSMLSDLLIRARGMRPEGIDSQLIRLGGKVATFLAVAWIVIQAADSLGIPVTPLVAGLGAGGLAVALASQYTLENLIAGLVIFADKPVRIGDECQFGSIRGRVEQIGLRSTRIRGEDRSLISVPNAEFAKQQLVNFTSRDHIPLRIPVTLKSGIPPRRLRDLLARLRQVLIDQPRLANQPVSARLTSQGPDTLTVEVSAIALTDDEQEFGAIREEVLLAIMDLISGRALDHLAEPAVKPSLRTAA